MFPQSSQLASCAPVRRIYPVNVCRKLDAALCRRSTLAMAAVLIIHKHVTSVAYQRQEQLFQHAGVGRHNQSVKRRRNRTQSVHLAMFAC